MIKNMLESKIAVLEGKISNTKTRIRGLEYLYPEDLQAASPMSKVNYAQEIQHKKRRSAVYNNDIAIWTKELNVLYTKRLLLGDKNVRNT